MDGNGLQYFKCNNDLHDLLSNWLTIDIKPVVTSIYKASWDCVWFKKISRRSDHMVAN